MSTHIFRNCSGITDVTINDLIPSISFSAFDNCTNLTHVIFGKNVTQLMSYAFDGCPLDTLDLANINYIGSYGSIGKVSCSELVIPATLIDIEAGGFSQNKVGKITVSEGNPNYKSIDDCLYSKNGKTLLSAPGARLTDIYIADSVTSIGIGGMQSAFANPLNVYLHANQVVTIGVNNLQANQSQFYVPCTLEDSYKAADNWDDVASKISGSLLYRVVVTANNNSYGTITLDTNNCNEITMTAIPNSGYEFISWNDENTDTVRTITVESDTTFTAKFKAVDATSIEEVNAEVPTWRITANTIENPNQEPIEVYNMTGKLLFTSNSDNINISNLARGIYIAKASGIVVKFLK